MIRHWVLVLGIIMHMKDSCAERAQAAILPDSLPRRPSSRPRVREPVVASKGQKLGRRSFTGPVPDFASFPPTRAGSKSPQLTDGTLQSVQGYPCPRKCCAIVFKEGMDGGDWFWSSEELCFSIPRECCTYEPKSVTRISECLEDKNYFAEEADIRIVREVDMMVLLDGYFHLWWRWKDDTRASSGPVAAERESKRISGPALVSLARKIGGSTDAVLKSLKTRF